MGFDGYQVKAGMSGPAQQLDAAGTAMDGVSSAVKARTTFSYENVGGGDAASALNAFVKAWEAEAKNLASALHELGTKVELAKRTYRSTDGGVRTRVDGVSVEGAGGLTDTSPRTGRPSALSGY